MSKKMSPAARDWLKKHILKPNRRELKKIFQQVQTTGTGASIIETFKDGVPRIKAVNVDQYAGNISLPGAILRGRSKYGARKMTADGHTFDSWLEFSRYLLLKQLQAEGKISGLTLQKRFELQPSFKKNGKTFRQIEYVADFAYLNAEGKRVVEDVKGFRTETFMVKHKMFEYKYPDLTLRIIHGNKDARTYNAG